MSQKEKIQSGPGPRAAFKQRNRLMCIRTFTHIHSCRHRDFAKKSNLKIFQSSLLTGRETERQTDRQTDRETERERLLQQVKYADSVHEITYWTYRPQPNAGPL